MAALEEKYLSQIISEMEVSFSEYVTRMWVRRMMLERAPGQVIAGNQIGTNLPPPYDRSILNIRAITGDPIDAVQHYAARIGANSPQPVVPRVAKNDRVARKVDETAAAQERWLDATWHAVGGRELQHKIAWSQSWARCGWYLTLPREIGFGLPDRVYYEELTDEQIEALREADELSPEPLDDGRYAESAENWIKRRREKARDDAVNGLSLFTLEAIPGDMVRYRFDRGRDPKYVYSIEEVPAADFDPGTDYMRAIAQRMGIPESEAGQFGIVLKDGKIIAGPTVGGERGSVVSRQSLNFIRFADRECIYYLVAGPGMPASAKLLWFAYHGAGRNPFVPAPGIWTDSRRPGGEFSSPMESVWALAPLLNQLETLASNMAAINATPRWVIEKPDGSLVVDEQGNPKEIVGVDTIGLDPSEAQALEGTLRQVTVDDRGLVIKMLEIYLQQMQKAMPPDVAQGEGGTSGAAWTVRMLQSAAQADLEQPVGNHATAVRDIMAIWVRWARLIDTELYALSVPHQRGNMRAVRGLIEIDPADLVEGFEVIQSKNSQADMVVQQQVGLELYQKAQVIDAYEFFETYQGAADPTMAVKLMWKERLVQLIMGTAPAAQPGSVLDAVFRAAQGRVFMELQRRFPNSAILTAQVMAEQAMMQAQAQMMPPQGAMPPAGPDQNHALPRGNVAEPQGIRQPGLGASVSLPGGPMSGLAAMEGKAM